MSLYVAALFFVLTPGVLLNIPGKNVFLTALVHSAIFALVYYFTYKRVWEMSQTKENFEYGLTDTMTLIGKSCSQNSDCPPGSGCWKDAEDKYVCK